MYQDDAKGIGSLIPKHEVSSQGRALSLQEAYQQNSRGVMKMKLKKKTSGFFIVEILIVLAIVAILVTALLPNLANYTNRAKFADVLTTANAVKPAVELCVLQNSTLGTIGAECGTPSSNGIPANTLSGYAANVSGFTVASGGVITATGAGGALGGVTYVLTPTYNSGAANSGTINWTSTGTCKANGLC